MNPNAQAKSILLALLWLALQASPHLRAQEEAAAEEKEPEAGLLGPIHVEIETWVAQPSGLQYEPATVNDPTNPFATRLLDTNHGTHDEMRYRLIYGLPKNIGDLSATYYDHSDETDTRLFDPGNFVFGELLTHPLYAGFANNGLADGFIATSATHLNDWHVDFSRPAFQSTFVKGTWSVGWRRVDHDRRQDATYYATLPDLPVLLPPLCNNPVPCPNLDPLPDTATLVSKFSGRGPELGIDLDFPLWHDKFTVEAGAALSVLRGKAQTSYLAQTRAYLFQVDPGSYVVLDAPYDELGMYYNATAGVLCPAINYDASLDTNCDVSDSLVPAASKVSQASAGFGLQGHSVSMSSDVLETYIGFRWKALAWLEVMAGFRSTRYDNVGVDLRPKAATVTVTELGTLVANTQDFSETSRSATYEGFYAGLKFRLHK